MCVLTSFKLFFDLLSFSRSSSSGDKRGAGGGEEEAFPSRISSILILPAGISSFRPD